MASAPVGTEYTVVGWCKNRALLDDKEILEGLLVDICAAIGMRPLWRMSVHVPYELKKLQQERFEDEGGASASLILSTSHINIHGWPYRDGDRHDGGFFWFTIGSCRSFDPEIVDLILNEKLDVTEAERFTREIQVP